MNMIKKEHGQYMMELSKLLPVQPKSTLGLAASKVLTKESIDWFKNMPELNHYGWAILDRWATSQPERLKELEQQSILELVVRTFEQQDLEQDVLDDRYQPATAHLATYEILQMNEVKMTL